MNTNVEPGAPISVREIGPSRSRQVLRPEDIHVLYVDDEPGLVMVVSRMLQHLGYHATGYSDPDTALEEFRARPHDFDIVVTDLHMPTMSGADVVRRVQEVKPGSPVAVVSGNIPEEEIFALRRLGVNGFIPKPVDLGSLRDVLRQAFSM
ncbi:MAG TPA: response regulator [Candidatus Kapabacteria bacterium]|nr:response regulator [Candidatus Kapabacteria bacterium]